MWKERGINALAPTPFIRTNGVGTNVPLMPRTYDTFKQIRLYLGIFCMHGTFVFFR